MVCEFCETRGLQFDCQCITFINRKGELSEDGGRCDVAIYLPQGQTGQLLILELKLKARADVDRRIDSVLTLLHQYGKEKHTPIAEFKEEAHLQAVGYAGSVATWGFAEGGPKEFCKGVDTVFVATIVAIDREVHSRIAEVPPLDLSESDDGGDADEADDYREARRSSKRHLSEHSGAKRCRYHK